SQKPYKNTGYFDAGPRACWAAAAVSIGSRLVAHHLGEGARRMARLPNRARLSPRPGFPYLFPLISFPRHPESAELWLWHRYPSRPSTATDREAISKGPRFRWT